MCLYCTGFRCNFDLISNSKLSEEKPLVEFSLDFQAFFLVRLAFEEVLVWLEEIRERLPRR